MLDRLANRYHTDPHTIVMEWSPERIGLAKLCLDARETAVAARCKRMADEKRSPMAVVDVGA